MLRMIILATAVAGTLDILFAALLSQFYGRETGDMLRYVASGPFPEATGWGAAGAILGLAVHFALMSMIAAAFFILADRLPAIIQAPLRWGVGYGLVTYAIMNLVVVPLRFPSAFPPSPRSVATQLFAHIVLVGLPISLIAARKLRR